MKYVLDASTAVRWVLTTPLTPQALRFRDAFQKHVHELIAPAHFPDEIASALTKAERQKLIHAGEARGLVQDVMSTPPVLYATHPLRYRAIDMSSQTRSAFYDCLCIALAEREGCELVTADDRLVNNVQARFPFVISLSRRCPSRLSPA